MYRYRPFELDLSASLPEDVETPLLDAGKCVVINERTAVLIGNLPSTSFDSKSVLDVFLLQKQGKSIISTQLALGAESQVCSK